MMRISLIIALGLCVLQAIHTMELEQNTLLSFLPKELKKELVQYLVAENQGAMTPKALLLAKIVHGKGGEVSSITGSKGMGWVNTNFAAFESSNTHQRVNACPLSNCLTWAWNRSETMLAIEEGNGFLILCDTIKKNTIKWRAHQHAITSIVWHPTDAQLATIAWGQDHEIIKIWHPNTQTLIATFFQPRRDFCDMYYTASIKGELAFYDFVNTSYIYTFPDQEISKALLTMSTCAAFINAYKIKSNTTPIAVIFDSVEKEKPKRKCAIM